MMKRWTISTVFLLGACGPSYGGQDVKTSDEWLAEEEKAAEEDERKRKASGEEDNYSGQETDEEKRQKFDQKQADMELKRATRSAASCPGVVAPQETKENKQRGSAHVTITFQEDGTVSSVNISSPFDGTPVGDCVLRAYKAVIVPPFVGGNQIIDWDVELVDAPEEAPAAAPAKKKK
jgi:hypothetical protein